MKKFCSYYFDLKYLFNEQLFATDHIVQNTMNQVNIPSIMKDKHLVYPVDNIDSDIENTKVYCIDNNLNSNTNREKDDDLKDPKSERVDWDKQNQRTLYIIPNIRYYYFLYHL